MISTNFPSWPNYSEKEIELVSGVLRSNKVNYWTGQQCAKFEEEFSDYFGCKHAIALSNGTAAIELALSALNIGEADEVIVTPRSFIASVSPVAMAGAQPVFADIDRDTQSLSAESIKVAITARTKAIIVVHLGGHPADMDGIMDLASKHEIAVIEDCAQAHGAKYKGKSVGQFGDIACWSFCQDKIMTTGGEGGMVTTNNSEYWKRMWSLKDHGKNIDLVNEPRAVKNKFRWLHDSFGSNHRMTEMQASIGRYQLELMDEWSQRRLHNAEKIWGVADGFKWLRCSKQRADITHAAYKAYVFVNQEYLPSGWDRDTVVEKLLDRGIPCFSGGCAEIYLEKAFDKTDWRPDHRLPNAKELGETSLMFLVHPTIEDQHIDMVCDGLIEIDKLVSSSTG